MKKLLNVHHNGKTARTRSASLIVSSLLMMAVMFVAGGAPASAADSGRLMGRVVDAESGEPLVGASVYLLGTKLGSQTDMDGSYLIKKIPAGTYTMIISGIGYAQTRIEDLQVSSDDKRTLDFSLQRETIQMDSIVVTGRLLRNTGATMLKHREKAEFVGDAISAEEISRSGSSDAASAMQRVTGASVMGDKYVYIRGLGDRYANTQLNGSPLPSPDPDRQAVPMDLIPANLLDNIVVQKTFTPDKPGDFSGGSVNLTTKDLPAERTLVFSNSIGYNSNVTGNDNYLYYPGGSKDWAGYDDGSRELPAAVSDADVETPHYLQAYRDMEKAQQLNDITDSFKPVMSPRRREAPLDQSYSMVYGDLYDLFDRPLGIQASLTYSHKYSFYEGGVAGKWHKGGEGATLNNQFDVLDSRGTDEVMWGGLASMAYKLHNNHHFSIDYMHNQSGESSARFMIGDFSEQFSGTWRTRVLQYTERTLRSLQFKGEHEVSLGLPVHARWLVSYSEAEQNDPDLRFISDHFNVDTTTSDTTFFMTAANYPLPSRYFRDLNEDNTEAKFDLWVPFSSVHRDVGRVQFGAADLSKDRTFRERVFDFAKSSAIPYTGDPEAYFSTDNLGIVESQSNLEDSTWVIGNSYVDATQPEQDYDGAQDIFAWYGMVNTMLTSRLQIITGVRYETTRMDVRQINDPVDQERDGQLIDKSEWLPALNIRYALGTHMNLRAAYGRTLARPTLREMAPFTSDEHVGGYLFAGNPDLEYTLIDNYDLRWEWFVNPGEVLAVSGFYKRLKDPIELAILEFNGNIQPQNVSRARVTGAEFEWRRNLGHFAEVLRHFQIGGNLTLVHSQQDIPESEMVYFLASDSSADATRPLQGQSPYLVNVDLTYSNPDKGFTASLLYNRFGERFAINAQEDTPDIYEQPRTMLDFTVSKNLWWGMKMKFAAKNLLDSDVKLTHEYEGQEYVYQSYSKGRSFSLGMTYNIF